MEKYMTLTVDEHMAGQTVEKVRAELRERSDRDKICPFEITNCP